VQTVSRLCEFYPGICLATEEKAQKNLSQGKKNLSQSTVYILPKQSTVYTLPKQYSIHITKTQQYRKVDTFLPDHTISHLMIP